MTLRTLHRYLNLPLAIGLLAGIGLAASPIWIATGKGLPTGISGIAAIATVPVNASTVYAVTNRGTIAKSVDSAASWRRRGLPSANAASPEALGWELVENPKTAYWRL